MGKIVVGVDGSDHARKALDWALDEAKLRGSDIVAVYAYMPNPTELFGLSGAVTSQQLEAVMAEADRQAGEVLQAMADVGEQAGVTVTTEAARGVTAAEALIEQSRQAELLVVGSRGRGGFKGMLLGSVSQQVTQHAHCPVVVISKGE